jgi:hypothetical protein
MNETAANRRKVKGEIILKRNKKAVVTSESLGNV